MVSIDTLLPSGERSTQSLLVSNIFEPAVSCWWAKNNNNTGVIVTHQKPLMIWHWRVWIGATLGEDTNFVGGQQRAPAVTGSDQHRRHVRLVVVVELACRQSTTICRWRCVTTGPSTSLNRPCCAPVACSYRSDDLPRSRCSSTPASYRCRQSTRETKYQSNYYRIVPQAFWDCSESEGIFKASLFYRNAYLCEPNMYRLISASLWYFNNFLIITSVSK